MAVRRLKSEWTARLLLVLLITGLLAAIITGRRTAQAVEVRAVMPEKGGWLPGNISAEVNVPLHLRLISEDVMHGFAVGQQTWPAVDLKPGQMTDITLTFNEPGTYTFYCTRWCGPNHWRMRGIIEVTGEVKDLPATRSIEQPLYARLGMDIDAPHEIDVKLIQMPSATRGESLGITLPPRYLTQGSYLEQTPFSTWQALRLEPGTSALADTEIWDLIAFLWRSQSTPESLRLGQHLYAQNCAACHGENGQGDGVMAQSQTADIESNTFGGALAPPSDFTDPGNMLGASSAVLRGKILRGGMGTGMPYWGTIFTDEEIEALVDYIWTFQFPITESE